METTKAIIQSIKSIAAHKKWVKDMAAQAAKDSRQSRQENREQSNRRSR